MTFRGIWNVKQNGKLGSKKTGRRWNDIAYDLNFQSNTRTSIIRSILTIKAREEHSKWAAVTTTKQSKYDGEEHGWSEGGAKEMNCSHEESEVHHRYLRVYRKGKTWGEKARKEKKCWKEFQMTCWHVATALFYYMHVHSSYGCENDKSDEASAASPS